MTAPYKPLRGYTFTEGGGYVYAPYIPLVVTPVVSMSTARQVPERLGYVNPWKLGNIVRYDSKYYLVLEVIEQQSPMRDYCRYHLKTIDQNGDVLNLETSKFFAYRKGSFELVWDAHPPRKDV